MSAHEIIKSWFAGYAFPARRTDGLIHVLTAAGYRLLGPDDAVTIENALRYAREGFVVAGSMPMSDDDTVTEIDRAIAILTGGGNG